MGHAALLYDGDVLHAFQLTLEPALRQTFPYPYPPDYLFAIWPLGWLPYRTAYLAWDIGTLALFLWAVFGSRVRTPLFWFVLLAPVTILTLVQGQNGLLTSALIVAGMRLMRERPICGGILLGLATIKPQLGILIPFALIAAGYWRTLAAAAITALLLVVVSGLAFRLGYLAGLGGDAVRSRRLFGSERQQLSQADDHGEPGAVWRGRAGRARGPGLRRRRG